MAVLISTFRRGLWWPCCLALAAIAGCRNLDNAQVDVLERELRQQEDYIYELEDYLIEYSDKLRMARIASQCEPSAVKTTTTGAQRRLAPTLDEDLPAPAATRRPRSSQPSRATDAVDADELLDEPPAVDPPADAPAEPVDVEEMEAPALEIGPVGVQAPAWSDSLADAPTLPPEAADAPLMIPDPLDYQTDADDFADGPQPAQAAAAEAELAGPVLDAPIVGGPRLSAEKLEFRHVFSQPAADGEDSSGSLLVVVEALNATDEPAGADGEASLMIMSRDGPGSFQRIERWDFTAEETAAAWQSSRLGDGLHLELPLKAAEWPEGELELWARLVLPDGRKLLTQMPFDPTQLASMGDAAAEDATLADAANQNLDQLAEVEPLAELEPAEDAEVEKTADDEANAEDGPPTPQWQASSIRLDPERVQGFATTASGKTGWNSGSIGKSEPRVAAAPASGATPQWKRSATPPAAEGRPAWTPFR